jgi:hypothetical protein
VDPPIAHGPHAVGPPSAVGAAHAPPAPGRRLVAPAASGPRRAVPAAAKAELGAAAVLAQGRPPDAELAAAPNAPRPPVLVHLPAAAFGPGAVFKWAPTLGGRAAPKTRCARTGAADGDRGRVARRSH